MLYNLCLKRETNDRMPVLLISEKANPEQMREMMISLGSYIKMAVDVERMILAGGGNLHSDCEAVLIERGSNQDSVWGADWFPFPQKAAFESMINFRPRLGKFSMEIDDPELRKRIDEIVRNLLGGVSYE